jgi:aspartate kinase
MRKSRKISQKEHIMKRSNAIIESLIVIKAGGGPMSTPESIGEFIAYANSNPRHRIFVLSAPGRTEHSDKITDLLIRCYDKAIAGENFNDDFNQIAERFIEISEYFEQESLDIYLEQLWTKLINLKKSPKSTSYDWIVSQGEYVISKIVAKILGATFVEPAECIFLGRNGQIMQKTYKLLKERLSDKTRRYVIPGFVGADQNGKLKLFPRGWSDVSGSVVAKAVKGLCINLKDVDGIAVADPRIIGKNVLYLKNLTYGQALELTSRGSQVLHPAAIGPAEDSGTVIRVVSVFQPDAPGTTVSKYNDTEMLALTGCPKCVAFHIYKRGIDSTVGFGEATLKILRKNNISFEHLTTGQQDLTVTLLQSEVDKMGTDSLHKSFEKRLKAKVDHYTLATVSIVSIGRVIDPALVELIAKTIKDLGIDFSFISKASGRSLTIGVECAQYERVILALYPICIS